MPLRAAILVVILSGLFQWPAVAYAQADSPSPDLPIRDRPRYFDEERSPIGVFQMPVVEATPIEVQAGDPLMFSVRITASGPVSRPPGQPRLAQFPGFASQFEIEPIEEGKSQIDDHTWKFAYTLKPRHADVKEIPSFPFVFFTPGFRPESKGYQTRYTAPISLIVKTRSEVRPSDVKGNRPPPAPASVYVLAGPAEVLLVQDVSLPGPVVLVALGLLPPIFCVGWYLLWQQLYPDAARRAHLRRSRAARLALRALQKIDRREPTTLMVSTTEVLADYLRQRLDLAGVEPTPVEVEAHLTQAGISPMLAERTAEFFRTCDVLRYAPRPQSSDNDLVAAAEQIILALEEQGERKPQPAPVIAIIALLIAGPPFAATMDGEDLVAQAEAAFKEAIRLEDESFANARQSFQEAARQYADLREQGYWNAALLRNEGNAWLLGGDLARAILAYRRGLRLAPNDRTLREGLAYAREQVIHSSATGLGRPPVDHLPPWWPRLTLRWLLVVVLGFYTAACLALTRWRMVRHGRFLVAGSTALFFSLLSGIGLVFAECQDREETIHPLVVNARDSVPLFKGNGLAYPRFEAPLNAGVESRLRFVRGDWLQIELASGEVGWVQRKDVLVDEP